jgi:hypothetical protein
LGTLPLHHCASTGGESRDVKVGGSMYLGAAVVARESGRENKITYDLCIIIINKSVGLLNSMVFNNGPPRTMFSMNQNLPFLVPNNLTAVVTHLLFLVSYV